MSNDKIKPKKLTWDFIHGAADNFRDKYAGTDEIPVQIEAIVEFRLRIEVIPRAFIKENIDMDGYLSRDMKTIFVDSTLMNERKYNRYRFTLAHEVGHLVLHSEQIMQSEFRDSEDWIRMRDEMAGDDLNWFEFQANEFAGRLLVPRKRLIESVDNIRDKIEIYKASYSDNDDMLISAVAGMLCKEYEVSASVIERRIKTEKIWDELGL